MKNEFLCNFHNLPKSLYGWKTYFHMVIPMAYDNILDVVPILTHPLRLRIIKKLLEEERPMYANELARELDVPRKNISFHLSRLKEYDFVEDELKIKSKDTNPVAVRYYTPTKELRNAMKELKNML